MTDAQDDTYNLSDERAEAFPQADILRFCVQYSATDFAVTVDAAARTDPRTEDNWQSDYTGMLVDLDTTGDGEPDFVLYYFASTDGLVTGIDDIDGNTVCRGTADFDGRLLAGGFSPSCLGNPGQIGARSFLAYDSDRHDPAAPVYGDNGPDFPGLLVVQRDGSGPSPSPSPTTSPPPSSPGPVQSGFDGDAATTDRLDGGSPSGTAIRVSQTRFLADGAAAVVLSRDDTFADSLAGSPLTQSAPLLLTASGSLDPPVREEIARVLPAGGQVYLLGGEAALSASIAGTLSSEGYRPVRLQGVTRIETAVAIAEEVRATGGDVGTVLLARADGPSAPWADSVTGGAWAAYARSPVMLTPTNVLHPAVAEALARYAPARTVLLGGTAALESAVEQAAPNGVRISGADRVATAVSIARQLWTPSSRRIIFNGYADDGWAYGLAAAGLSADTGAPLLISGADAVPVETLRQAVVPCGGTPGIDVLLVGPPARLGAGVADPVTSADGGPCPDLSTARLPLPPGESEVERAVSGAFAVAYTSNARGNAMFVSERIGSALVNVAAAGAAGEYFYEARVDAIGHVLLVLGTGAHSGTAYVWGFEGGVPRLHPADPEGFFTSTGVTLIDPNGDGILELRVYENDYDPSYVNGTTTWIDYGWTGVSYERVGGSPPLPLPPTPTAAIDGLLTAWRAGNVDSMYGYGSGSAVYVLQENGPPMQSWYTDCSTEGADAYCFNYEEASGFALYSELSRKQNGSWHVTTIYTGVE